MSKGNYYRNEVRTPTFRKLHLFGENPEISTQNRSKSSVERPKQAKSIILLDFSRILSTQISSGMARTYTRPIPAIPKYHPSLKAFYTSNILFPTWPSKISSKFSSGIASPYTKHKSGNLGIILPYRKFSTQLRHHHRTGAPRVSTFNTLPFL